MEPVSRCGWECVWCAADGATVEWWRTGPEANGERTRRRARRDDDRSGAAKESVWQCMHDTRVVSVALLFPLSRPSTGWVAVGRSAARESTRLRSAARRAAREATTSSATRHHTRPTRDETRTARGRSGCACSASVRSHVLAPSRALCVSSWKCRSGRRVGSTKAPLRRRPLHTPTSPDTNARQTTRGNLGRGECTLPPLECRAYVLSLASSLCVCRRHVARSVVRRWWARRGARGGEGGQQRAGRCRRGRSVEASRVAERRSDAVSERRMIDARGQSPHVHRHPKRQDTEQEVDEPASTTGKKHRTWHDADRCVIMIAIDWYISPVPDAQTGVEWRWKNFEKTVLCLSRHAPHLVSCALLASVCPVLTNASNSVAALLSQWWSSECPFGSHEISFV